MSGTVTPGVSTGGVTTGDVVDGFKLAMADVRLAN
jgi:hypothetical protein